eukprot:767419-Hanusia_phi.AAC.2
MTTARANPDPSAPVTRPEDSEFTAAGGVAPQLKGRGTVGENSLAPAMKVKRRVPIASAAMCLWFCFSFGHSVNDLLKRCFNMSDERRSSA